MIADVEEAMARQSTNLDRFRAAIRAIVELNARSSNEQRLILNDLSFLSDAEQTAIKALERQLVDTVSDLLIRLDTEGKIVKRSKKVYAMMLFGMLNFSHTWYDPKGDIEPKEFADMVVELFLYGFSAPAAKGAVARRKHA
jgi:Tetracyclin repressor-like, C-terminal domain